MEFLISLFQSSLIFIGLAIVAIAGVFFGKFLRSRKNQKAVEK